MPSCSEVMSDFDPQSSEPPATRPPDESGRARHADRSTDGEYGLQPPPEPRDATDRSHAQPTGRAGPDRPDGASPTRPQSLDDLFVLVTDQRRRRLLSVLCDTDGPITVSRLTRDIAARSDDVPSEGTKRAIEISLVHDHLPRLASMDLVTYDRDRRRVRTTAAFARSKSRLRSLVRAGEDVAGSPD